MPHGRTVALAALVIALGLAIAYGFMPRPALVDSFRVERGLLEVTVVEEGKTRVVDRYVVSAPVAGFARRVEHDVGDHVTPGEVVVTLDPLPAAVLDPRERAGAEARVAAAQATLSAAVETARAAAAERDYARAELARFQQLVQTGGASEEEVDQARAKARGTAARYRSSQFAVEVARSELEAARTALQYSAAAYAGEHPEQVNIEAPVQGQILKIFHQSEGVVQRGEPLLEVGDPRALEVEVDVLSADAVRMRPGTPIRFLRWGREPSLEGKVRVVEPVGFTKISALGVEEQRVLVIADIASAPEQWERLGHGYRVEAQFILERRSNVLLVPTSALFRKGDGWAVFAIEDQRARLRSVRVGSRGDLRAEVSEGLREGERVITNPPDALADGARVRARQSG